VRVQVGLVVAGLVAAAVSIAPASADPSPGTVAGMSVAPMQVAAISTAQAGELVLWDPTADLGGDPAGHPPPSQLVVPAELQGVAVKQVLTSNGVSLALTAAGNVVGWGGNAYRLQKIPAELASGGNVIQIAANLSGTYAGAVTKAGTVVIWGLSVSAGAPSPLTVPAGLTGVTQLLVTNANNGVALKSDGSVVAWGGQIFNPVSDLINQVPDGLRAKALAYSQEGVFALTTDGTVVAWGRNLGLPGAGPLDLPAELSIPHNVKAVNGCGVAMLADDSLVMWGRTPPMYFPASVTSAHALALNPTYADACLMLAQDGTFHAWFVTGQSGGLEAPGPPAAVEGRAIAQFATSTYGGGAAIITKMLRVEAPVITGTGTVGGMLTGTPGTFSASPTSVTGQWLANGSPIAGATGATLPVTAGLVGAKVTYQSTAAKPGETTISSVSEPVTVMAGAAPPPVAVAVASKTTVTKVSVAKKAASVTVSGKVTASKSPAGTATVTIKKGKKTIVAKPVKVDAKGTVTLSVKKFAQLVAKALKVKGKKAKTAFKGKYTVTIAYAGTTTVQPSTASKAFTIKK